MSGERVKWVDTTKFLGILAIYVGHFAGAAGKSYPYVFSYHVPLFFFLSGCMSNYDKEPNLGKFIIKKCKTIMIPFWVFSAVSLSIYTYIYDYAGIEQIENLVFLVAKGAIRDTFFAYSLWFLTCLFVMEVAFKILKYIKNRWLILGICWFAYCIAEYIMDPGPIAKPSWWYNADSALRYILYFAIGYIAYPYILKLFELDSVAKKTGFAVSGVLAFLYSFLRFEGVNPFAKVGGILAPFGEIVSGIWYMLAAVMGVLLLIWFNLVMARLLENIRIFTEIGRETLYLCGNEYVIKSVTANMLNCVGLSLSYPNPLCVYLYSFFLLVITVKWLAPVEKGLVASLVSSLDGLASDFQAVWLKRKKRGRP